MAVAELASWDRRAWPDPPGSATRRAAGEVAPACIGWHQPEGYVVVQGRFYSRPWQAASTLTTHDPDEAAAEAERLLAGRAWSGQDS